MLTHVDLPKAIETARKRLKLTRAEYAVRVGLSHEGLRKIIGGGGVNGATLARLQRDGGIRVTGKLIQSLDNGL